MRPIHLLYAPTMACNLACSYCYLGDDTDARGLAEDAKRAVPNLQRALAGLEAEGVLAFNVSLHGGEVTTLPEDVLEGLFSTIRDHYRRHADKVEAFGGGVRRNPHIKTNLYRFGELRDLLDSWKVSVSASVDLPLSLHGELRRTKGGRDWRARLEENLRLLAKYPHKRKLSSTFTAEHVERVEEICSDIRMINDEFGFDMNDFNVMFAFGTRRNLRDRGGFSPADGAGQVLVYEGLRKAFLGTGLHEGVSRTWFEEFGPGFCTNCENCGERFVLINGKGDAFSCVRAQGVPELSHGNVFTDGWGEVLKRSRDNVAALRAAAGLHDDCGRCAWLSLCNTGCPAAKLESGFSKSYSCDLQRAVYRDLPALAPERPVDEREAFRIGWLQRNVPAKGMEETSKVSAEGSPGSSVGTLWPSGLGDPENGLLGIMGRHGWLQRLFSKDMFALETEDGVERLESQLLKGGRKIVAIGGGDRAVLHMRGDVLDDDRVERPRNTVYLQLLRDTPVVYGGDGRAKQEHLFTYQAFAGALVPDSSVFEGGLSLDLGPILSAHAGLFRQGVSNNLFVTTSALRDRHYAFHSDNGYYHAQTMNLPFQNFEFFWIGGGK